MLESRSGAFYAFVQKSPSFLSSLLPGCKSEQLVNERLDSIYRRYSQAYSAARLGLDVDRLLTLPASQASPAPAAAQQVQKYVLGGGGITVQPGLQKITDTLVKVTPYVHTDKDHIIVFFGTLSNLDDLVARRREFKSKATRQTSSSTGALTTQLMLDLYKHFHDDQELIMLSELQGQYAFVVYDGHKKQAFAARDPTGIEPLYYRMDGNGSVSFTNSLDQLPEGEDDPTVWSELPPGHFMSGKQLTQFALTPKELQCRERKESLDADALHMMLQREQQEELEEKHFSPMRSLIRNISNDPRLPRRTSEER